MITRSDQTSELGDQWSTDRFEAQRALYLTSDLRTPASAERGSESVRSFTLFELLIVVGIVSLLLVLLAPAFTTIKGGTEVTSAAYTIKGVLDTARTHAKAQNTYTWVVGFADSVGSKATGSVALAVVASKNLRSAHRGVLVFLQRRPQIVQFGCDCPVCLGYLFFEGFVPAKVN